MTVDPRTYSKLQARRRLVWLLLIFPVYKLVESLIEGSNTAVIIWGLITLLCVLVIISLEIRFQRVKRTR